jgi:outer membrane cobalamin receptor
LVCAGEYETDSVRTRTLKTVTVNGHRLQLIRSALPVQLYSENEIGTLNAVNVTDVARYFSGVTVKDYGGIGGLKTVSLRGMGSHYTGVSYDGMIMSDVQSGQIDLGRFSLDNIAEISLTNGQPNDIFQSARAFSAGGVLSLKTKLPEYNKDKTLEGKVALKAGSFGMLNPSLFLAKNAGEKWVFNLSADALMAHGEYKFLQYYGTQNNISEELTRVNSDVKSVRTEVNGLFRIQPNENISLKMNYFDSERGLPGGVTFYNHDDSNQRLQDQSFFSQMHYENKVSKRFQQQYFARFNRSFNHFTDKHAKYAGGILDNTYLQKEYYLASAFKYTIIDPLVVSAAVDWWYNDLVLASNINFSTFSFPVRHTGMANVAAKYVTENMTLGANLLYLLTRESVRFGTSAPEREKLSPGVNMSYKLLANKEIRLRAFYKNIYRLPTFNDLYYQEMGNNNLRPENANQFNVGFTYLENEIPFLSEFAITADGYYNRITDKIIAIPRDLFHWSMTNKGKVDIKGVDVSMRLSVKTGKSGMMKLISSYTYQNAKDATPDSDNYGEQIPYTPVHSGSASLSYHYKYWETGYNMMFSGERWIGQMTQSRNRLDDYMIHSVFANTSYKQWKLNFEIINLLNTQYEVVKFYPMPRRNYRMTLAMSF